MRSFIFAAVRPCFQHPAVASGKLANGQVDLQMLDFGESLSPRRRDKTGTNAGCIDEVFASIEVND
jgi:hypothetical protein